MILRSLAVCLALLAAPLAHAQNMFAPVVDVDGRVVTAFELDQRARMMRLFQAPGDPREAALDALIDERLQLAEARRQGVTVTDEQLAEGKAEFAGRAGLETAEFIQVLAAEGIDETTFDDFVRAGQAWRTIVRQQFGSQAAQLVTPEDVEEAAKAPPQPGLRVLLSEIILPANTPQNAQRSQALLPRLRSISTLPAFASAAREYSASPSRDRGGRLDWLALDELPPQIRNVVQGLQPGEVTPPIEVPNAIALFQLRAIEETDPAQPVIGIDYAAFYIPGGGTGAAAQTIARLDAEVQTCDDLYSVAQGLPAERLQRDTLPPAQIPGDVAVELAQLDPGERSVALSRAGGQTRVYLMLCERLYKTEEELAEIDRNALRDALVNRRVGRQADAYLAELRANATITYP
ncbi:periplasmic chaperone for outer membrane proteins SurA [Palleronia salina]|uniref:Parvulin-like PPIase n=1 Tax=Palleronia salina TaxID=313368 RepID=A0A1M6HVQ0_9RHOB|nr:peptidylprolyl isomerase [Palleronia salina]SHJ26263.1 periplasmic chaperone for outer membrane proteins SurA [Palleronia salina]